MAYDPLLTTGLVEVHASYREEKPVSMFLRDFFFGNAPVISKFPYVTIETLRDGRKISVAIRRGANPLEVLAVDAHKRHIYVPPYFSEKASVTAEDLSTLSFNEKAEAPLTGSAKALLILAEKRQNIEKRFQLTEEKMCADILLNSEVSMVDGSKIVYGNDATLIGELPSNDWDDTTGVNILADLKTWGLRVFEKSGVMPNSIVVAPDVHEYMISDAGVQKVLDTRNYAFGEMRVQQLAKYPGVTYGGRIAVPGCGMMDIYTYAESYDNNGSAAALLPTGSLIMANTNNMGRILYAATEGPVDGVPAYIPGARSVFVDRENKIPPKTSVIVQMAPLPCPISLDTWLSANILTAAG